MKNGFRVLLFVLALSLLAPLGAWAQSCTVSVSLGTASLASSTCFVPAGGTWTTQITGTWVGTADIQQSIDGGTSYKGVQQTTANDVFKIDPITQNSLVRVMFLARTSGTLTGTIYYNTPTQTPFQIKNVSIGNVAYSSLGNNNVGGGSTKIELSDVMVPQPGFYTTGAAVLFGATTGNGTAIVSLYDTSGNLVLNSVTTGTTAGASGANAFSSIAWTPTPNWLPAGHYYLGLQLSGTTDTYRSVAASTFVDVVCGEITGAAYGTLTKIIVPPTTCTANKGPIFYLY